MRLVNKPSHVDCSRTTCHRADTDGKARNVCDSGPPFRRSARVNPNPNPDPRNGGPPEWRTPGMRDGTNVCMVLFGLRNGAQRYDLAR